MPVNTENQIEQLQKILDEQKQQLEELKQLQKIQKEKEINEKIFNTQTLIIHSLLMELTLFDIMNFFNYLNSSITNQNVLNCIDKFKTLKVSDIEITPNKFHKYDFLKILSEEDVDEFVNIFLDENKYEQYAKDNNLNFDNVIMIIKECNKLKDVKKMLSVGIFKCINMKEEEKNYSMMKKAGMTMLAPLVFVGGGLAGSFGGTFMYLHNIYHNH